MTNEEAKQLYEAQTQAEQFVDDVTLLRMLRIRNPQADPALYGADGTSISNRHMRHGERQEWDTPLTDIAHRFPDGSLAIRQRATQRWEVWRTW